MMSAYFSSGTLALVTGGASGIGRAVCNVLAREGARVVIGDINEKAAKNAASQLADYQNHWSVEIDVSSKDSVNNALKSVIGQFKKPPTLLANVAGITRDSFALKMSEEQFMEVINVNLKGTFLVNKAVAASLIEHEISGGAFVNISSIVSVAGNMGQCNYASSKSGVEAITKTLAKELAKQNIRVNCVLPGFTETPMVQTIPDKVKDIVKAMIPLRRFATPEEIAEMVVFLLSDRSSYMTGNCIPVSGGFIG